MTNAKCNKTIGACIKEVDDYKQIWELYRNEDEADKYQKLIDQDTLIIGNSETIFAQIDEMRNRDGLQ